MRLYEVHLKDFGKKFLPAMPWTTIATALHYFKRFYLRKSVMDYHPKEILVTCLYLACKVGIILALSYVQKNTFNLQNEFLTLGSRI